MTGTVRHRLRIVPRGGLLLGGHEAGALFADDATARDAENVPVIPASAVKGAIREQAERIAAGAPEAVSGLPADTAVAGAARLVQEIFGVGGTLDAGQEESGGRTGARIGEGRIENEKVKALFEAGEGYALRHGVSIHRRRRRAADGRLYLRETVAPFIDDLEFVASVETTGLSEPALRLFEAAVRSVFAIGSGRTAGLGGVEFVLGAPEATVAADPFPLAGALPPADAEWVRLLVRADEPLSLGQERNQGNHHATAHFIPARTLRGAVIASAMRHRRKRADVSEESGFKRAALDPESCLRITDAFPVENVVRSIPRFAPQTLQACKTGQDNACARNRVDHLVEQYRRQCLLKPSASWEGEDVPKDACPECGGRLQRAPKVVDGVEPSRIVHTRTAMDRRRGGGEHERLYSVEALAAGTTFVALVNTASTEARELLADALRAASAEVGHGRGRGFGRIKFRAAALNRSDLGKRIEVFDKAVRGHLGPRLEKPAGTYFSVTALSDVAVAEEHHGQPVGDVFRNLLERAGVRDCSPELVRCRVGRRGGWDSLRGRPKPQRAVIEAGSVLLLWVGGDATEDWIARLDALEGRGVGELCEEGLGWVRFSDPIHLPSGGASR